MKEVRAKSIFTGQCHGLSKMFSMENRSESYLGSKTAGGRELSYYILTKRMYHMLLLSRGRTPKNPPLGRLVMWDSGIYCI